MGQEPARHAGRRTSTSSSARDTSSRCATPTTCSAIYAGYEAAKEQVGAWDFEDLLWQLADLLDEHPEAAARLRARFRALTVDEYQDVNPLQQALLDHWTSEDADLCVVGDDYQTIYAFTGASPSWLLELPAALPRRDGRPARGELPLHPAGARARQPTDTAARRIREGAALGTAAR